MPSTDNAVRVLPLPDSPITPTISPAPIREADVIDDDGRGRAASRRRSRDRRSSGSGPAGAEADAACQSLRCGSRTSRRPSPRRLKPSTQRNSAETGNDAEPGRLRHEAASGIEHVAPGRIRRLRAEAEEAQRGLRAAPRRRTRRPPPRAAASRRWGASRAG